MSQGDLYGQAMSEEVRNNLNSVGGFEKLSDRYACMYSFAHVYVYIHLCKGVCVYAYIFIYIIDMKSKPWVLLAPFSQ